MDTVRITAELELDDSYLDEDGDVDESRFGEIASAAESALTPVGMVMGIVEVTLA